MHLWTSCSLVHFVLSDRWETKNYGYSGIDPRELNGKRKCLRAKKLTILLLPPLRNNEMEAGTVALLIVSVMNISLIALFAYRERQHGEIVHDLTLKLITRTTAEFLQAKEHEFELKRMASESSKKTAATEKDDVLPADFEELDDVTDEELVKAVS